MDKPGRCMYLFCRSKDVVVRYKRKGTFGTWIYRCRKHFFPEVKEKATDLEMIKTNE